MFGPWIEAYDWLLRHRPRRIFSKPRLTFLSIHYIYVLCLTMIVSILLYPAHGLRYVDALFFAAGTATQSGLNTVDFSAMNTYQQIVIYIACMMATPIFINSCVVFIRLYWFEKRFQHVVRDARSYRRTRSRSKTETKDERDPDREERGVNGRSITVLHDGSHTNGKGQELADMGKTIASEQQAKSSSPVDSKGSGSGSDQRDTTKEDADHQADQARDPPAALPQRDITFADEVGRDGAPGQDSRRPSQRPAEHHIAFLENQRNPHNHEVLRIPGPRDFDRGDLPKTLLADEEAGDVSQMQRRVTDGSVVDGADPTSSSHLNSDDHPPKRSMTMDRESDIHHHPRRPSFSNLRIRRPGMLDKTASYASGNEDTSNKIRSRSRTFSSLKTSQSEPMPYLSWTPTVGRNSAFADLTAEQREELGGIEYRSLKTLAKILLAYFIGFHVLGVIVLLPWIERSATYGAVVEGDAQSKTWWGFFTPASMLNDLGFTLTPDSMISFQQAVLPLLFGSFLIIIGNTGFPCMLRFLIWLSSKLVPVESGIWEELKFLLDHPRRCFTLLFPSKATWWLFWILALLNSIDLIFFIILDLDDPTVTVIPRGYRVLNGWFQATSTRTAGFACVNLALLHPAIQVSYLVMMYISVFPIAISVRRTNVYEEKSLGIYGEGDHNADDDNEPSYIGAHLRKQLSFDLWYVFLGLFIIAIAEAQRIENPADLTFTTFTCLFEIVSAYGTVGLSLGYPGINASFSAEFTTVSKLVIIAMMIRGRHRGLPYELDRAILLPSESLHSKEDDDANRRVQRRRSNLSAMAAEGHGTNAPTSPSGHGVGPLLGTTATAKSEKNV